jgi:molybdopterin converting factor small subunit
VSCIKYSALWDNTKVDLSFSCVWKLRRKMAKICVLLFGSAKDLCNGASEYQYEAPEDKVELCKVVDLMMEQYPKLRSLQGSFMMAVNCEYVDLQQPDLYVSSRDEIAIIPPVR